MSWFDNTTFDAMFRFYAEGKDRDLEALREREEREPDANTLPIENNG